MLNLYTYILYIIYTYLYCASLSVHQFLFFVHNLQQLEYRWVQTGNLQTESNISSLSWNLEGTRLLTGGELLQLWHQNITPFQEEHSKHNLFIR